MAASVLRAKPSNHGSGDKVPVGVLVGRTDESLGGAPIHMEFHVHTPAFQSKPSSAEGCAAHLNLGATRAFACTEIACTRPLPKPCSGGRSLRASSKPKEADETPSQTQDRYGYHTYRRGDAVEWTKLQEGESGRAFVYGEVFYYDVGSSVRQDHKFLVLQEEGTEIFFVGSPSNWRRVHRSGHAVSFNVDDNSCVLSMTAAEIEGMKRSYSASMELKSISTWRQAKSASDRTSMQGPPSLKASRDKEKKENEKKRKEKEKQARKDRDDRKKREREEREREDREREEQEVEEQEVEEQEVEEQEEHVKQNPEPKKKRGRGSREEREQPERKQEQQPKPDREAREGESRSAPPRRGGDGPPPPPPPSLATVPLPPGWKQAVDKSSGRSYFYNKSTNETSWEPPSSDSPPPPPPAPPPPLQSHAASSSGIDASDFSDVQRAEQIAQLRGKLGAMREDHPQYAQFHGDLALLRHQQATKKQKKLF